MDPSLTRALLWGIAAYSACAVGLVGMKHGSADVLHPRRMFETAESRRRGLIWLLGAGSNFGCAVLLSVALKYGHASVLAALNGYTLVGVALLSRVFLGERLSRADRAGIAAVVVGVVLVGLFGVAQTEALSFAPGRVTAFAAVLLGCNGALVLVSWRRGWWKAASVLGVTAGLLAGLGVVLQKIFVDPVLSEDGVDLWALLPSPWFWLYLIASNGSLIVLQIAYQFGRAVQVAPALVSLMILVTIAGGVVCFDETLSPGQVLGTAVILTGVLLLTAVERPADSPPDRS